MTLRSTPPLAPVRTPQEPLLPATGESVGSTAAVVPHPGLPAVGTTRLVGDPSGVAPAGAVGLAPGARPVNRGGPFDLIRGREMGALSLPELIRRTAPGAQGETAVREMVAAVASAIGLHVPAEQMDAIVARPEALLELLSLTPAQMSAGFSALSAGAAQDSPAPARLLPQRFDLGSIHQVALPPLVTPPPRELVPGILHGDMPSRMDAQQMQRNRVMAEVLDRLADNASRPTEEQFVVVHQGREYRDLDGLLGALREEGYVIEARVVHRVANFAALWARGEDGQLRPVAAPLMVRTGVRDSAGNEAVVPAIHSELQISLSPPTDAPAPAILAQLSWYQGTSGTGFFPAGVTQTPAWLGSTTANTYRYDDAWRAVALAGHLGSVVRGAADAQDLRAGGYGVTGVCNDSVSVIQHAMGSGVTGYPLLMQDEAVLAELQRRSQRSHAAVYAQLAQSIAAVPADGGESDPADSARRALVSLPWAPGSEPMRGAVEARRILSSATQP